MSRPALHDIRVRTYKQVQLQRQLLPTADVQQNRVKDRVAGPMGHSLATSQSNAVGPQHDEVPEALISLRSCLHQPWGERPPDPLSGPPIAPTGRNNIIKGLG